MSSVLTTTTGYDNAGLLVQAFTTWLHCTKNPPLLELGLPGPVTLQRNGFPRGNSSRKSSRETPGRIFSLGPAGSNSVPDDRVANAMKAMLLALFALTIQAVASDPMTGLASWYGIGHRGKVMANGERFDPGKMTAASWHYPLGTRVRVTLKDSSRSVTVTITDRGPAPALVRQGRIIDLAQAAFEQLATPNIGLVAVTVKPVVGSTLYAAQDSKSRVPE